MNHITKIEKQKYKSKQVEIYKKSKYSNFLNRKKMYLINLSVFNILKANKMEIFFNFKIQEKRKYKQIMLEVEKRYEHIMKEI